MPPRSITGRVHVDQAVGRLEFWDEREKATPHQPFSQFQRDIESSIQTMWTDLGSVQTSVQAIWDNVKAIGDDLTAMRKDMGDRALEMQGDIKDLDIEMDNALEKIRFLQAKDRSTDIKLQELTSRLDDMTRPPPETYEPGGYGPRFEEFDEDYSRRPRYPPDEDYSRRPRYQPEEDYSRRPRYQPDETYDGYEQAY